VIKAIRLKMIKGVRNLCFLRAFRHSKTISQVPCAGLVKQTRGLLLNLFVPLDFAGSSHYCGQGDEEEEGAEEERITLKLENRVEISVEHGKDSRNHPGAFAGFEHSGRVTCHKPHGHNDREQVCPAKTNVFGERQEQEVEEHKSSADQEILEWVNSQTGNDLKEVKGQESKGNKEDGVFNRATDECVKGNFAKQINSEGGAGQSLLVTLTATRAYLQGRWLGHPKEVASAKVIRNEPNSRTISLPCTWVRATK